MENASKALIIAGAILLAISIIGIGMYVFSQAQGAMSGIGMDKEKIKAYNGDFEMYAGTQNGSSVRALCDAVRNHNLANRDDVSKQIAIQTGSAAGVTTAQTAVIDAGTVNTFKASILTGKSYFIDFGYDTNTGYIVAIGVSDPK